MTERPSGITIIAGLQIFGAVIALLMLIGPLSDYIFFENTLLNELYKIFLIIMVVISLIVAYGLLKGMKWAWSVTIIFQIIYIPQGITTKNTQKVLGSDLNISINAVVVII